MSTQWNWTIISAVVDALEEELLFEEQSDTMHSLFSDRCKQYVSAVQRKLRLKLQLHSLECNEVNLFTLLMSAAMDSIIEYTNESLMQKGMPVLTTH